MFFCFFCDPLRNSDFFHTQSIWNDVGVVTNTIDDWSCAKFFQLFARKLFTFIAAHNFVPSSTVQKTMVGAIPASLTYIVGKATMTFIRKGWTRAAKQTAY